MRRAAGFTMIELVAVMVVIAVLAAIGIPRLMNRNDSAVLVFGDQVVSALRLAQKNAVARRRLVCVSASGSALTLRMATQPNAQACDAAIEGIGDADFRSSSDGVGAGGLAGAGAVLYFQPDGAISSDGAGAIPAVGTATVLADGAERRSIRIDGRTGHVE